MEALTCALRLFYALFYKKKVLNCAYHAINSSLLTKVYKRWNQLIASKAAATQTRITLREFSTSNQTVTLPLDLISVIILRSSYILLIPYRLVSWILRVFQLQNFPYTQKSKKREDCRVKVASMEKHLILILRWRFSLLLTCHKNARLVLKGW